MEAEEPVEGRDGCEMNESGQMSGTVCGPVPSAKCVRVAVTFSVPQSSRASGQGHWNHHMAFPMGKLSPTAFLWRSLVFKLGEEGSLALCVQIGDSCQLSILHSIKLRTRVHTTLKVPVILLNTGNTT